MSEETVNPPDEIEEVVAVEPEVAPEEPKEEQNVPLSALQKERRKRQEIEAENRWLKEQSMKKETPAPEPDESRFESATREDLSKAEMEIIRKVEERSWIKNNPERYEKINELLPEFLKRRPNLAQAINAASNRYEEAWELMDKLSPREQKSLKTPAAPKKEAPGNPASVPKGAAMNQAVDVMTMNDAEFNAWRKAARSRR